MSLIDKPVVNNISILDILEQESYSLCRNYRIAHMNNTYMRDVVLNNNNEKMKSQSPKAPGRSPEML